MGNSRQCPKPKLNHENKKRHHHPHATANAARHVRPHARGYRDFRGWNHQEPVLVLSGRGMVYPKRIYRTNRRGGEASLPTKRHRIPPVAPIEIDVLTTDVIEVLTGIVISPSNSVSVEAIFPDNKTRVGSE